jgi:uncharacterized membrane protein
MIKPSILAIRSIGAEFANRIYTIVAVAACIISAGLLGLSIWLTTFSGWWWVLVSLLIIAVSVVVGILGIVKLIIRYVRPAQSPLQKKQTKAFVDKLQRLSEVAQTPKFILLFQIVRDIATPRENGFIASLGNNTSSLKHEFVALVQTFKS